MRHTLTRTHTHPHTHTRRGQASLAFLADAKSPFPANRSCFSNPCLNTCGRQAIFSERHVHYIKPQHAVQSDVQKVASSPSFFFTVQQFRELLTHVLINPQVDMQGKDIIHSAWVISAYCLCFYLIHSLMFVTSSILLQFVVRRVLLVNLSGQTARYCEYFRKHCPAA